MVLQRLSRFWFLITLASVIAADSMATVIGTIIVAPLMTPILGTMLPVVLADPDDATARHGHPILIEQFLLRGQLVVLRPRGIRRASGT